MKGNRNKQVRAKGMMGLRCPKCGGRMRRVKDSRPIVYAILRRRQCSQCGHLQNSREELA